MFYSVPLCYVYPAMLHYKAAAHTRTEKLKDIAMMVFGMVAAIYTTIQTVRVCPPFVFAFSFSDQIRCLVDVGA